MVSLGQRNGFATVEVPIRWASIKVPAVVHRISCNRWWTALRLSTLRCRLAGTMIKAIRRPCRNSSERFILIG